MSTEDDFRAGLRLLVQTFAQGMADGAEGVEGNYPDGLEAEIAAAMMDTAVELCLKRGVTTGAIVEMVREHAVRVNASVAARAEKAN